MCSKFNTKDIFLVPSYNLDRVIVYAPLRRVCFSVNKHTADIFNSILSGKESYGNQPIEVLNRIKEIQNYEYIEPHDGDAVLGADLSLILSQKCNLNCSYCYARMAHSNEVISFEIVKRCIDYIFEYPIDKARRFTFIGGGEPTMTWPLLKQSIEYIRSKNTNHSVYCSIVTNGTLLTKDRLLFLKKNDVRLVLSFDILEHHQNAQRPLAKQGASFGKVVKALQWIQKYEVNCNSIRTTITEINVSDMLSMVESIHNNYPFINLVDLEPVTDSSNTVEFYEHYIESFMKTRRYGKSVGITVYNSISSSLASLKTRFCKRELCLTPTGDIVCCHRVSSKNDSLFNDFIIGHADINGVALDWNKIHNMNINKSSFPECNNCFAKYNCAGGCLSERLSVPKIHTAKCYFTKKMLTLQLQEQIDSYDER